MVEVGSSGRPGSPAPSCCGSARGHPDLDVRVATGDTQAGTAVADLYPSLAPAYPDLAFTPYDPAALDGLDLVFLGLPHGASQAIVPELLGQGRPPRRPGRRLPAAGPVALPAVVRRGAHRARAAARLRLRAARAVPRRDPGRRPRRHAGLLPDGRRAGAGAAGARRAWWRPTGSSSTPRPGVSGAGRPPKPNTTFCAVDEDFTAYGLLDHRHTPEMEQVLGASVLFTPAPRADEPRHPGHLLRPAHGRHLAPTALLELPARRPTPTSRSSSSPTGSPSTKATLGSNCAHVTARLRRAHRLGRGHRRHRQPHQGRVGRRRAVRQPPPRPPRDHRPPHRGGVPVTRHGAGWVHAPRGSRAASRRRAIPT